MQELWQQMGRLILSPAFTMERWYFICLLENGQKHKLSAEAPTPEEAKQIILNRHHADTRNSRIKEMMLTDM